MRRSIGVLGVTCLALNAIVGSGIFALPDDLYRDLGALSPLAFALCAIGLLPVALCYAEAASGVERSGGPYVYAQSAFGPDVGFAIGWMCFANAIFSAAAVAAIAAAYLLPLLPASGGPGLEKLVAVAALLGFALLNYCGARLSALTINLFTFSKLAVLVVLTAALLPAAWAGAGTAATGAGAGRGAAGLASAVFAALFALQGFEIAPVPAGETRAPQRAVPIAVVGSLLGAALLYIAVQWVLVRAVPDLGTPSERTLTDAALGVVPALGGLVTVGAVLSTLGFVAGAALGTPRYLFAQAEDGQLPRWLAAVHPRFGTPHRAVAASALLAAGFIAAFDYRALLGMSNVAVAVQYLATCLAVLRLRRLGAPSLYRAPGGPLVPLLGSAVSLWVFSAAPRAELLWAGGTLAVGLLVRAACRRAERTALPTDTGADASARRTGS